MSTEVKISWCWVGVLTTKGTFVGNSDTCWQGGCGVGVQKIWRYKWIYINWHLNTEYDLQDLAFYTPLRMMRYAHSPKLKNYKVLLLFNFWRERAVFQRSAFGRSTASNDVVATISICLFFFFSPVFFSPSRPFLIEGVLGSKNLFSESCLECPKTYG